MKKLGKLTLKEMRDEMPIIPKSILEKIKGGDVTVTFDRSDSMIYIYADGILLDSFPAANNVDSNSQGIWSNGTYSMYDQNSAYTHSDDSYESSYGTHGIFRANSFIDENGCERTYMGLHSGRSDNYNHPTYGCIRTTDAAMSELLCYIGSYGSFTSITVRD